MTSLCLDTNILIYMLMGNESVRELVGDTNWFISYINEMELQMKPGMSREEKAAVDMLLKECHIIEMNSGIKEKAIKNAYKYGLKLADSIILGTAQEMRVPILTADHAFKKVDEKGQDVFIFTP